MRKILLFAFILSINLVGFSQKGDVYWNGNGASDNISDGNNWWGSTNPSSGDNLYFNNTQTRHWVYTNYAGNNYFGNIITYNGAGGIKIYGDNIYAYKFENNSDPILFEISPSSAGAGSTTVGNRTGSDLEINPVGSGGILISCDIVSLDNTGGTRNLKVYGDETLTIEADISENNGAGSGLYSYNSATIYLSGNNTYSGVTEIHGGILELQSSLSSSPITIKSGAKVVINGSSLTVNDVTIESGGILEINAGMALNIVGNLVNNGIININSDATGTGSFKVSGTISGSGTANIQQFVTKYSSTESVDGWHFLSSPVSSETISGSDFEPGAGEDLYEWGESSGEWLNYNGGTFGDVNFEVGKGYLVAYQTGETKTFSGSLNTGSVTKNASFSGSDEFKGYNLFGNPFTSAIDWDNVSRTVANQVHVIQSSGVNAGDYAAWVNGAGDLTDGIIPANQGFMVLADGPSQSITMDRADQVLSTQDFYKSDKRSENTLKVNVSDGLGYSNLYIRFNEGATSDYDREWDAHMLFGYSNSPKIFAYDYNTNYSVNSLSSTQTTHIIDFGIRTVDSEEYTLSFSDIEQVSNLYSIIQLEDKATGSWIEIEEGTEYNFIADEGDNMDRFKLHFGATGINEIQKEALQAYVSGHQLYIVGEEGPAELNVFNLQGQQLLQEQIQLNAQYCRTLNLKSGIYLVSLRSQNETKTTKISIR